jgi:hypothetical protein
VTQPLKASVQLKDNLDDTKDQVKWKWNKGVATLVADFKDPVTGSATMQFCVYDASLIPQPRLGAALLAGGICGTKPCWKGPAPPATPSRTSAGTPQGR